MEINLKQAVYQIYIKYLSALFLLLTLIFIIYFVAVEYGIVVKPVYSKDVIFSNPTELTFQYDSDVKKFTKRELETLANLEYDDTKISDNKIFVSKEGVKKIFNLRPVFANPTLRNNFKDIYQIIFAYIVLLAISFLYFINRDLNNLSHKNLSKVLSAISSEEYNYLCDISEFEKIRLALKKTTDERNLEIDKNKEKDNMMKKQIAFINHDMKTPISIIKSSANLIKKDIASSKMNERLDRIIEQSDVATNYLNELQSLVECFKLTKNGEKLYDLEFISKQVKNMILLYVDMLEIRAEVKIEQSFTKNDGGVIIDLKKLEKSLIHILNNAAHHKKDKALIIEIFTLDKYFNIRIIDDGDGFAGADFQSPKKLFHTSNKARTLEKGYGIGLFYVDTYLSVIGGKLELENKENGKGAVVTIKLEVIQ